MATPADGDAIGVYRAERLAGVLDDPRSCPRELLESGQRGGVAEDVHRQQRPRALRDRACGGPGSRLSVTGSMSANTGVAPSYSAALAEATNENGLVMTSSPPPHPPPAAPGAARGPLLTAHASGAPTRAVNSRSNSSTRGPSDS